MLPASARARRSVLYMPGSNSRALEKARTLAADCLIFDLEDAVAPDAKDQARQNISAALKNDYGAREIVVRINALDSNKEDWGKKDCAALCETPPDVVLCPKISTPEDIHAVSKLLPPTSALWVMIETPQAIFNLAALAACAATTPLRGFVMGTNDLSKDIGARHHPARTPLLAALSLAVMAARAHQLAIIDGVYNDIKDEAGFARECEQGEAMGFDGKTLIHPSQIAPCNEIFAPSAEEIETARAIIAAFAAPENQGAGVLRVNGKMVELLHRDHALRRLAIYEAIHKNP